MVAIPDIVVTNASAHTVTIRRSNGGTGFSAAATYSVGISQPGWRSAISIGTGSSTR